MLNEDHVIAAIAQFNEAKGYKQVNLYGPNMTATINLTGKHDLSIDTFTDRNGRPTVQLAEDYTDIIRIKAAIKNITVRPAPLTCTQAFTVTLDDETRLAFTVA